MISAFQATIACVVVLAATGAAIDNLVSGEALVGLYGTVLGYVFGFNHGSAVGDGTDTKRAK